MHVRRRRPLAVLLLALLLVAAAACERGESRLSRKSTATNRLVNAILSDPKTFNPILVTDATSSDVLRPIFQGLVDTDLLTALPKPLLAESWGWNGRHGVHLPPAARRALARRPTVTAADGVFAFAGVFDDKVPNSARFTLTGAGKPIRP